MSDIILTQAEADTLLKMEKYRVDDTVFEYPGLGGAIRIPLIGGDDRESFILDVNRSRANLEKGTYQNRARGVVILARLDFAGAPHRNPDDEEIPCPHIHIYREGYGDKWAYPLSASEFRNPTDAWELLHDFMRLVNIVGTPDIRRGLFL